MTTKSQCVSRVRFRISSTGSPALEIISRPAALSLSSCWPLASACKRVDSSPALSLIPSRTASACVAAAMMPPKRMAFSAWLEPSLQKSIFSAPPSLRMVPGQQAVNDNTRPNQRQRHEGQPNARAGEIGGGRRSNLRPNGRARVHHQGDQNIDITFDGMSKRAIAGGDHDFKKIRPYRDVSGDAKEIDHRRHTNVPGASAEESAE